MNEGAGAAAGGRQRGTGEQPAGRRPAARGERVCVRPTLRPTFERYGRAFARQPNLC